LQAYRKKPFLPSTPLASSLSKEKKMKKFLALVALSLVLAACGKSPTATSEDTALTSLATNFSTSFTQENWNDAAGSRTGVFTVGQSNGSPAGANKGGIDGVVFKYDFNGNVLWKKQIASLANDAATDVAVNPSGQVYVLGGTDNKVGSTSFGQRDVFVTRYDANGTNQKTAQLGGAGYDDAVDIVLDKNQVPYVLVTLDDKASYAVYKGDLATFTFTKLPLRTYSNTNPKALSVDSLGNVYILSEYGRSVVDIDKYSSTGVSLSYLRVATTTPGVRAFDLRIDNDNIYVSYGLPNGSNVFTGIVKKYSKDFVTQLWEVNLGLNTTAKVVKVAGDGVYLGGAFGGGSFIARYTSAGKKVWSDTFSTPTATGSESVEGLATAAQINAVFPAGYGYTGSADGFVTRTNATTGGAGWLRQ
jgi:hypothetical protein